MYQNQYISIDNTSYIDVNSHFCGRISELKILETNLISANSSNHFIQLIAGLGGVGKTELILQFLFQHASKYKIIYWFKSDQLKYDLNGLIQHLQSNNYVPLNVPVFDLNDDQIQELIKTTLNNLTNWLLLFDDFNSYEEIVRYFPNFKSDYRQHIIITSRYASWPQLNNTIVLDILSEEETLEVFKKWYIQSENKTTLKEIEVTYSTHIQKYKELAKILSYFPLAITQASSYIFDHVTHIETYLYYVKNNRNKLWDEKYSLRDKYTIKNMWEKNLGIISHSRAAYVILNCCAFLNPDDISINIFYRLHFNKDIIDEALNLLKNYFFITPTNNPKQFKTLSILQTLIKDRMSSVDVKMWQNLSKYLQVLPLKELCFNNVVEYVKKGNASVIIRYNCLPNELKETIISRDPRIAEIIAKFRSPLLSIIKVSDSQNLILEMSQKIYNKLIENLNIKFGETACLKLEKERKKLKDNIAKELEDKEFNIHLAKLTNNDQKIKCADYIAKRIGNGCQDLDTLIIESFDIEDGFYEYEKETKIRPLRLS